MSEPEASAPLPPSTIPSDTQVTVRDFENEEAARNLGATVFAIVRLLGSMMDLSKLDGITIGVDYDAALASIDRGRAGLRPLARSDTKEMQGVAMSPAVLRDGEVRTHLVFNAEPLAPLICDDDLVTDEDRDIAIRVIAHECAHVEVNAEKERLIPEMRFGTVIEGYERAVLFQLVEVAWDEYAACRLSAPFAAGQTSSHAKILVDCVELARSRSNEAIKAYRRHGDIDQLVAEAGPHLCTPMKAAAYLLGGMDADNIQWSDVPEVRSAIEEQNYAKLIDRLHAELQRLWDSRGQWEPTLATFAELEEISRDTFRSGGLFFSTDAQGRCRIDVPFTLATTPLF